MPGIARDQDILACGAKIKATQGHTFVNGRAVIRLGDTHDHGGSIITASSNFFSGGIPVARIDDIGVCPFHGPQPIKTGSGDSNNG